MSNFSLHPHLALWVEKEDGVRGSPQKYTPNSLKLPCNFVLLELHSVVTVLLSISEPLTCFGSPLFVL